MDHDHLIVAKVVVIRFLTQYRNIGGQTTWTRSHPSHTFMLEINPNNVGNQIRDKILLLEIESNDEVRKYRKKIKK